MIGGSGSALIDLDPDPGGPKAYGSGYTTLPGVHCSVFLFLMFVVPVLYVQ
jgi:hypothetical protein